MDLSRNFIVLAIGGTILLMAVRSLRAGRLKERYALLYFFIGVPFLVLAIWRDGMAYMAALLEIDYRTLALLVVTTFVVIMNLKLLSIVSVQERKINDLAQRLGILLQTDGCETTDLKVSSGDTTRQSSPHSDDG